LGTGELEGKSEEKLEGLKFTSEINDVGTLISLLIYHLHLATGWTTKGS
jgi:hypothetical protein